ncbi:hypothetical protein NFX46_17875 [Streptomyces phaeoluteigriseus]|uniref:Prokaryotic glutathione synthetase ATP-binding domain-containing protein n=1 Tax=Streptomyces phaeoluteigriseus TaxID=114686 RepID=A0ABY4Z8U9_9ACTN|nr:hypothetical protein [Streptomyces phaeoluteigriseus]USQ85484.1 hypothetical protein NFX46_17875 [Streptomyces phaeoluteigriseus]
MTTANGIPLAVAQAFLLEVSEGDKRLFLLLDGRPLGGFLRRPSGGDFRADMAAGGMVHAADLDKNDLLIAERIARACGPTDWTWSASASSEAGSPR